MKNIIACTAFFFSMAAIASAQIDRPNAIKITPLQPMFGKFSVQYERAYKPKATFALEYQHWNERIGTNVGLPLFGFWASANTETHITGARLHAQNRYYPKGVYNGFFMEGGGYIGQHNVTHTETTTVYNPFALFDGSFDFYKETTTTRQYSKVMVAGLKGGLGLQKDFQNLLVECSAGLQLNALNSHGAREPLSLRPVTPYGRLRVGVKF